MSDAQSRRDVQNSPREVRMGNERTQATCALAVIAALAAAAPAVSHADGASDDWKFNATIYAWLPTIGGDITLPTGGGGSIKASPGDILSALNFAAMGVVSAEKGRWGVATDVVYMNVSSTDKSTRNFSIPGYELPLDVKAKLDLGIKSWVWTTIGSYRVNDATDRPLDVFAGVRLLNMDQTLKWHIDGTIVGLPLPGRDGRSSVSDNNWNGVVGVKGQLRLGDDGRWFIPYYVDVGTGDADVTWQGILGAGYSFDWGDLVAVWRYLDYNMPSKDALSDLYISGAAVGVTFHF
jgi:hypothetical protein